MKCKTEEEKKEARRLYHKQWREANKEKIAEYKKQYYQNNKEKFAEYYQENKEKKAEYMKQWYETNRKKVLERQKQYQQVNRERIAEYYQANKEKIAEYNKQHSKTPMGRAHYLVNGHNREDKKYNRGECSLTSLWVCNYIFPFKCIYCGEDDWRQLGCDRKDNSLPHTPSNVVPCCGVCNTKRGTKPFEEFVAECNAEERLREWEEFLKQKDLEDIATT